MRTRVYVAGPYSKGDPLQNTHAAIDAGNQLLDAGYAPMVPHLSHYWHERTPRQYEDWLSLDLAWVTVAHGVLRLPGESSGAEREVALAKRLGIPVFADIPSLKVALPATFHSPEHGHPEFFALLNKLALLHPKKSLDYGTPEDPLANYSAAAQAGLAPDLGCWSRAQDKIVRINNYYNRGRLENESVEDAFIDLAAHTLISLLLLRERLAAAESVREKCLGG